MIDKLEKNIEAIGIDGKHATLPKLSSTHVAETPSSQGMVRIPLIISQKTMINWIGASIAPAMDLISLALLWMVLYSFISSYVLLLCSKSCK